MQDIDTVVEFDGVHGAIRAAVGQFFILLARNPFLPEKILLHLFIEPQDNINKLSAQDYMERAYKFILLYPSPKT